MPGEINQVKSLLKSESITAPYATKDERGRVLIVESTTVSPIPILHNENKIFLQFCGWSINLYDDGTWCWEDTTGG